MQEYGPAGLKAAMELLGYSGGVCRGPLPPISEEKVQKIKKTLEIDGFLWWTVNQNNNNTQCLQNHSIFLLLKNKSQIL